jgi:hypothetical protein
MTGRSYDTPPRNLTSLEHRLRNVVEDGNLRQRTRRQIAYMAVIAALSRHARDDEGNPLFAVKGGVDRAAHGTQCSIDEGPRRCGSDHGR